MIPDAVDLGRTNTNARNEGGAYRQQLLADQLGFIHDMATGKAWPWRKTPSAP